MKRYVLYDLDIRKLCDKELYSTYIEACDEIDNRLDNVIVLPVEVRSFEVSVREDKVTTYVVPASDEDEARHIIESRDEEYLKGHFHHQADCVRWEIEGVEEQKSED